MATTDISRRKGDHIDLAATGDVGFVRTTTLFECVRLVHDALPELDAAAIDTSVPVLGKVLRAPIIIAAMTGGIERAERINRELASIAEERGYGFGVGSQRAMHLDASRAASYRVREVAPTALLLGNVGLVQAREMSTQELTDLSGDIGADALCVHLNPAMEAVQPGGDHDFRHGVETLARLVAELPLPLVVKETGCGLSQGVGRRLREVGVCHVDVSGAGGTSWVAVEMHRAEGDARSLGESFRDWGIPTAASTAWMAQLGFRTVIATGGVASGLDVAKALALGADAAGIARPVLRALLSRGRPAALSALDLVEAELRTAMLLTGAQTVGSLKRVPRVVLGELATWLSTNGTL